MSPKIKSVSEQEATGTLGKMSDFIDQFKDTLKDEDSDNSLIATLQKADSIISNLDGQQSAPMKSEIKAVVDEIQQYSNSEKSQDLSKQEKASLNQLEITMRIIDKLSL